MIKNKSKIFGFCHGIKWTHADTTQIVYRICGYEWVSLWLLRHCKWIHLGIVFYEFCNARWRFALFFSCLFTLLVFLYIFCILTGCGVFWWLIHIFCIAWNCLLLFFRCVGRLSRNRYSNETKNHFDLCVKLWFVCLITFWQKRHKFHENEFMSTHSTANCVNGNTI